MKSNISRTYELSSRYNLILKQVLDEPMARRIKVLVTSVEHTIGEPIVIDSDQIQDKIVSLGMKETRLSIHL